MKRVLLTTKLPPTCFCISFFFCLLACNHSKQNESENLPELFDKPVTIPVNTKEGYRFNPFFNDTVHIKKVVNSFGDTVITGRPYAIRGKVIAPEKLEQPISVPAGKPISELAYSNLYPVPGDLKVIPVDKNQLQQFVYGRDSVNFILKNSTGELVPTGIPIPVIENKVMCQFQAPVKAGLMFSRYDASHNIRLLDVDQGLNSSSVTGLLEDEKSNLWFSYFYGCVSRYDGNAFTHFCNQCAMPTRGKSAMLKDKSGNLWIGTRTGGVGRFDGTYNTTFTEKNGLPNNVITCLAEDKNGNIWIGTQGGGASCYSPPKDNQPGTLTNYTLKEGLSGMNILAILEDKNGNLWFGSEARGVTLFEHIKNGRPEKVTYLNQRSGLTNNKILDIIEDKTGNIWFATASGVCRYDLPKDDQPGRITQYSFSPSVQNISFKTIHEDRNGNIWFGTLGAGVIKLLHEENNSYENGMFVHYTREGGLPDNSILSIVDDKSGNIWLGTLGGGVACIKARAITHLGKKEGFTESIINTIYEDRNENLWFGTNGDGLIMYERAKEGRPGTYYHYTTEQGLPDNFITCVKGDNQGNLWLGISNYGLCLFDGKSFTTFTVASGLSARDVSQILIDRKGNVWTATQSKGLNFLAPGNSKEKRKPVFIHYSEKEGLLDNHIEGLYEDHKGDIWIASQQGISRLHIPSNGHEAKIMHFSEKEGLPNNFMHSVFEDQTKNLWFASSEGLICYASSIDTLPGTFTFYGILERNKLNNFIRSIGQDHLGNIWFGTTNGLGLIIRNQDSGRLNQRIYFAKPEGLKGKMFLDNSVVFDHNHLAWWSNTFGGVEVIDMNNFQLSSIVPQPKLMGLDINERFVDFRNIPDTLRKGIEFDSVPAFENYPEGLKLSYNNNNLIFHFSAIDWTSPQKIRYSFHMKGLNDIWSDPSTEAKAEFRGLHYGEYVFEVSSLGETQEWSKPYQYHFRISPPWWYAWWAFVMYGSLGGFVFYRTYRFQLDRKLAIAEKQRLVELDRVKNRLYTNITHEFRTPLTLIHGPVIQALSKNTNLEKKDIQSIHKQSERLQQLINQMLELQKLEAGMLKPNYAYGEIIQTLRYLFGSFETWAGEKNIA